MSDNQIPKISIGVLTYNHEKYIEQCLSSLIAQIGNFELKIIIHDDCSTDSTEDKIQSFIERVKGTHNAEIYYHRHAVNQGNLGLKNLEGLIAAMQGSDYFCLIDGDDCYSSQLRLALHLQLHQKNPAIAFSYNRLQFEQQGGNVFEDFNPLHDQDEACTEDLIAENFIGNLGCTFYNSKFLTQLPSDLFSVPCFEWFFNTYYSQFGSVLRLNKFLNIYRNHGNGIWSNLDQEERRELLLKYIGQYNKYLNYRFDSAYSKVRERLLSSYETDLLIIDDFFPSPQSGFRLQELTSILEALPNARVFARGKGVYFFGEEAIEKLVADFKCQHPELDTQVQTTAFYNAKTKLLYINFINTADALILKEGYRIPFVLTIYPGGGFALNSDEVDKRMALIFSSPYFRKAIVTQQITYDYLLEKKFCREDQLELIFGVVTPLKSLQKTTLEKLYYGLSKETLDICFVAHKYTSLGQDKGYDTFIKVAQCLAKKVPNINFHVVGPWSSDLIDVSDLKDRLSFYGAQNIDWFDEFYLDKDILLSPNIPNQIYQGSFDGFPTSCATDAALSEVAIFCTDCLNLNQGRFQDGDEIVIINPDAEQIAAILLKYYNNPEKLISIAKKGAQRVRDLYNYEAQIAPRLKILQAEIAKSANSYSTLPVRVEVQAKEAKARLSEVAPVKPIAVKSNSATISLKRKILRKAMTAICLFLKFEFKELYRRFWFNAQRVINRYCARLKNAPKVIR